ncbi:YadA-like family protein [Veillonella criceti]|uniref:Collagen triple helix repeat (20 copies) n=1 Tax=Veillonella criceti TaxID=103891 RepID=A0A380NMQ5_9FIRM|nr:YadA-like family protein [Veillonella criceti]SUP44155.1 Collagen triple helix repeat (20 copies) [Veillonella criceti]
MGKLQKKQNHLNKLMVASLVCGVFGAYFGSTVWGATITYDETKKNIILGNQISDAGGEGNTSVSGAYNFIHGNGRADSSNNYAGRISGDFNTIIGSQVGRDRSGNYNVSIGDYVHEVASGDYKFAMGYKAGMTSKGNYNFAFGSEAGHNVKGNNNIALMDGAGSDLQSVTTVENGVEKIEDSNYNLAIGYQAGSDLKGSFNYAFGSQAGKVVRGNDNVAFGAKAGQNVVGTTNYAFGTSAGQNVQGDGNYALGTNAGQYIQKFVKATGELGQSVGNNNIALGKFSGSNIVGNFNVGIGENAGRYVGYEASSYDVSNVDNFGEPQVNVKGTTLVDGAEHNIALGFSSGNYVAGQDNFSVGVAAGSYIEGDSNVALGKHSGQFVTGGENMTFGARAGVFVTGDDNVAIGVESGRYIQGDKNISIGSRAGISDNTNHTALANKSNTISIGNNSNSEIATGIAIGSEAKSKKVGASALGVKAKAIEENTLALGAEAEANVVNSVALGSKSSVEANKNTNTAGNTEYTTATVNSLELTFAGGKSNGIISVGTVGNERRIQNVAAGLVSATSTDAINGSQLYSVINSVTTPTISLRSAGINVNKNIASSYTAGTNIVTSKPLHGMTFDFGDGLYAEEKEGSDGKKVILVGVDKSLIKPGEPGIPGKDGVTIKSIESDGSGNTTVTFTDDQSFVIKDGAPGKNGTDGKTGPKGDTGERGPQGPDGKQGAKGDTGERGPQGPEGKDGIDGKPGLPGKDGTIVEVSRNENTGETIIKTIDPTTKNSESVIIKDGKQGLQGEPGPKGDPGETGPQGPEGKDGTDGKPGLPGTDGKDGVFDFSIIADKTVTPITVAKDSPLVEVHGDSNIQTIANGNTLTVSLNKDITVNSVTTKTIQAESYKVGDATYINEQGLNANNKVIKNVAAGEDMTDAANVGQLRELNNTVSQSIHKLQKDSNRADAMGAALAALSPLQYDPLEPTQIMAGYGYYGGENAFALGLAHYKHESLLFRAGVAMNGGNSKLMANAGVTWKFGDSKKERALVEEYRQGPISSSYVLQDKVDYLENLVEKQQEQLILQEERLKLQEAKLNELMQQFAK